MVALAKSSPGGRSASALQSKKATVILEPIQELVESDESFVIPLRLVDSQGVRNVEA
jgi:hypothetical protein